MRQMRPFLALAAALAALRLPQLRRQAAADPDAADRGRASRRRRAAPRRPGEAITVVPPTAPARSCARRACRSAPAPPRSPMSRTRNGWRCPTILFGRLLSETIAARTGRVVLDPKQFTFDPGQRLTGTLQTFGLEADRMEAVAGLRRGRRARRRRGRDPPLRGAGAGRRARRRQRAAPALNQAANQVAARSRRLGRLIVIPASRASRPMSSGSRPVRRLTPASPSASAAPADPPFRSPRSPRPCRRRRGSRRRGRGSGRPGRGSEATGRGAGRGAGRRSARRRDLEQPLHIAELVRQPRVEVGLAAGGCGRRGCPQRPARTAARRAPPPGSRRPAAGREGRCSRAAWACRRSIR